MLIQLCEFCCSLLDNNEFLGSISAEIYDLKIVSESQVDENQLTSASFEPSCKSRSGSWYALLNRNLRVCLVKVTFSIKDGHFCGNKFHWMTITSHLIPQKFQFSPFFCIIPWDGHKQPIQLLKKLEFLISPLPKKLNLSRTK